MRFPVYSWLVSVAGLVCCFGHQIAGESSTTNRNLQVVVSPDDVNVVDGAVNITGLSVPYYYCQSPTGASNARRFDIVLLHGASLTREHWKKRGIMQALCANSPVKTDPNNISNDDLLPGLITVTALDLSISATYTQLRDVLDTLGQQGLVQLPITSLVSPSASGFTVMDWITAAYATQESATVTPGAATFDGMDSHFSSWIPIASPAVLNQGTEAPLQALRLWNIRNQVLRRSPLKVLAVHGGDDNLGIDVSKKLYQTVNAQVVEIPEAGHQAYMAQPNVFVQTVRTFLMDENVGLPPSLA
jgi:hypothetical protein